MDRYSRVDIEALGHWAAREVNNIPDFDPRAGNHYWITVFSYHVDPTQWERGQDVTVDGDDLAFVRDPYCHYCQLPYSPRTSTRRCKGES